MPPGPLSARFLTFQSPTRSTVNIFFFVRASVPAAVPVAGPSRGGEERETLLMRVPGTRSGFMRPRGGIGSSGRYDTFQSLATLWRHSADPPHSWLSVPARFGNGLRMENGDSGGGCRKPWDVSNCYRRIYEDAPLPYVTAVYRLPIFYGFPFYFSVGEGGIYYYELLFNFL